MQSAKIHTMIGLNDRQLFWIADTCAYTSCANKCDLLIAWLSSIDILLVLMHYVLVNDFQSCQGNLLSSWVQPVLNTAKVSCSRICTTQWLRRMSVYCVGQSHKFCCVACEAWSTHRDHDSVGVRGVTLLITDQYLLNGCINFIQNLQKSKSSLNAGQVRIKRYSAKFRRSYGRFYLYFGSIAVSKYHIWKDATISFKVYREVKLYKIQVKFEFGG